MRVQVNNGTHVDWADWSEVAAEEDNPRNHDVDSGADMGELVS